MNLAPAVANHRIEVDGVDLFYREAGPKNAPVVLLLHGFPSSSHQFRELMPVLAVKYRVLAPDYPGFGFTEIPDSRTYEFTTANIVQTMEAFIDALQVKSFTIYLHDFGAPVGMRLAMKRPHAITTFVVQNGNIYEEGWSSYWDPVRLWWTNADPKLRTSLSDDLQPPYVKAFWEAGTIDGQVISPETYTLDSTLLAMPGRMDAIMDLFFDHRNNVAMYPDFQKFVRESKVPLIVFWGSQDPAFVPAGADAYKRDIPNVEVKHLNAGHFLLETHLGEIAPDIMNFLGKYL